MRPLIYRIWLALYFITNVYPGTIVSGFVLWAPTATLRRLLAQWLYYVSRLIQIYIWAY